MLFDLLDSLGVKTARWKDDGILLWGMTTCKDDSIRINEGDTLTLDGHVGDFGLHTARLGINGNGRYVIVPDSEEWSTVVTHDTLNDVKNYIDMKRL